VDYWDWKREAIRRSASDSIRTCCEGRRGTFHPASFLAVAPTGRSIAGAALLVQGGEGPNLDLLFVRPRWHRRGLATALVQSAVNTLHDLGETHLDSGHNVANDASAAWHREFGFIELPDWLRARDEAACAEHELWRREQIGDLDAAERVALETQAAHWRAVADELEQIADRDGYDAVSPLRRHRKRRRNVE
jgi:GNAT superfamily N-acetyltransferase